MYVFYDIILIWKCVIYYTHYKVLEKENDGKTGLRGLQVSPSIYYIELRCSAEAQTFIESAKMAEAMAAREAM